MHLQDWLEKIGDVPWTVKAFLVVVVGIITWNWLTVSRRRRIQASAESWPSALGKVVAREIKERKQSEEGEIVAFIAVVRYEYQQDGQQTGIYRREFDSSESAGVWLDLLYEKEIPVRYDPAKPSRSTLLDRDMPPAPSPLATSIQDQAAMPTGPMRFVTDLHAGSIGYSRVWLKYLSLFGLTICCVVHVVALISDPFNPAIRFNVLFILQIYAIVVGGISMTLDRDQKAGITSRQYRKQLKAITPEGLRISQKVLNIYAMAWMALFFYRTTFSHSDRNFDPLPLFSAFQGIFLLEAYRMTQIPLWRAARRGQSVISE
jgi:hypothetical protein